MEKKVLKISGMSCGHCEKAVTDALKGLKGVQSVNVNLQGSEVTVSYNPGEATEDALKEAVEKAGYEVISG